MSSNEIKVLEKTRQNLSNNSKKICCLAQDGGGGVLPYMGYIGMCGPRG